MPKPTALLFCQCISRIGILMTGAIVFIGRSSITCCVHSHWKKFYKSCYDQALSGHTCFRHHDRSRGPFIPQSQWVHLPHFFQHTVIEIVRTTNSPWEPMVPYMDLLSLDACSWLWIWIVCWLIVPPPSTSSWAILPDNPRAHRGLVWSLKISSWARSSRHFIFLNREPTSSITQVHVLLLLFFSFLFWGVGGWVVGTSAYGWHIQGTSGSVPNTCKMRCLAMAYSSVGLISCQAV